MGLNTLILTVLGQILANAILNEAIPSKRFKMACKPTEDSDQPARPRSLIRVFDGRPRSLIRVFDGRSFGSQESNVSSHVKQRL